jgi:hypothetical protein
VAKYNDFVTQNASSVKAGVDVAARFCGAPVKKVLFSFEKAAGDIANSVWRIARISPFAKIISLKVMCDAITGLTEVDAGFYKPLDVGGTEIDANCLKDGISLAAGTALIEIYSMTAADIGKEAYLIAGVAAADADRYGAFDVALTGNSAGTDVGTIAGILEYVE